ncbi:copper-transporting ATPase 1, putative [Eimeria tenella]|uniref:Copper-transporting ATPase 1, putative n=1 Tax=Eimeria tenella TaxID=5802 RepID=U6KN34_EIMTE|nr:copper-transporting ATPase 1, putative [Eimeria tenella]CDJ38246.1 copper-transporting ATPase 1, putative [Eimeria tenella]|eukprot:XP_013229084.1 copper-transporting ATPase 1, putative [Eimeria tenella]
MKQMGISPTPLHRNKLESEASDYTGCGAVSTELPKRPSCCGSSISNNTRCTENMSPSDTLHGSMTSDITAEEAPTSSIYAAGDSELKLLPACQTLPNYSESGSQTGRQECTSSAAAMSCEGGLAFFRFSHLWALPSKRSEECTGRSSSTACSGDGSGNCCADLLRKQQQELAGMESSPGTHANYQILDSTAGELEAGCVLWALSCLEQGSSHAVGLALVGAYDRWRRRYNSGEAEGIRTVKNIVEEPEELNRQFPPPRPCENVLMLQRGIEGSMPITEGLYLRLRVAAASPEDSESDGRRSQQCQTKGISSSDVFQLEEWTSWHESHNGPVVNLHASVSSAASRDAQLEWVWLGSVALQDEVERETKVAVDYLRQCMGFKVFMCTGDNPRTAARVAAALEIPESCVMAQQTPEGKVSFLRSLVSEDTSGATTESTAYSSSSTASSGIRPNSSSSYLSLITRQHKKPPICCMVGDGLNDSPALAEAALGVAFGVGNALPLAAAAVAVGGQSWTELVDLFRIARQTQSIIRWNFLWACAFNLVAVPLAAGVAYPTVSVHPAAAAAAMAGSCLLVLLNAQRLTRFKATTTESMELELSRLSPTIQTERQSVEKRELEDFASEESPKSDISLQLRDDYPSSHRVLDDDIIFASINAPVVPAGFGCQVGLAAGAIGPLELPVSDSDSPFFDDLLQFEGQDSMSC